MHADNWAQKAKSLGYRSRAVFKLIQIIEKIKQIKNPNLILDIGAAPGGWSHYLANKYPRIKCIDAEKDTNTISLEIINLVKNL